MKFRNSSPSYIVNESLTTGVFPSAYKVADICPIFKSGDRHDAKNYRPVSLLPICSKILEKCVHRQIMHHVLALDSGSMVGIVFADMSKAFDRVSHTQLLQDLSDIGLGGSVIKWFASYLDGREQRVVIQDQRAPCKPCARGVPQGSVLGPLLFSIYIRKVPSILTSPSQLYADDITFYKVGRDAYAVTAALNLDLSKLDQFLSDALATWNFPQLSRPGRSPCGRGQVLGTHY